MRKYTLETKIKMLADNISERFTFDEPLDGDEVDFIADRLRAELNLRQGNITNSEYESDCHVTHWKNWFDGERRK